MEALTMHTRQITRVISSSRKLVALTVIGLLLCAALHQTIEARPGDLDLTFGRRSKLITDFGGGVAQASGMALQPDGKIVVVGGASTGLGQDFAIVRYNSSGSIDPTFGSSGKVLTDFGGAEQALALAFMADGRIVVAGQSVLSGNSDFALARYNSEGSLDQSFGSGGKITTDLGGFENATAVAVQPDGKILITGALFSSISSDFGVLRYNADGTPDPNFGKGGVIITDFGQIAHAQALVLQPDGKIVAAGWTFAPSAQEIAGFALVRYNADGSLDSNFGSGGKVLTDFGFGEELYALGLQPDGKIVAAGRGFEIPFTNFDFALARYNHDGSLDTSFDSDGITTTDFGAGEQIQALSFQLDGKIVVAGYVSVPDIFVSSSAIVRDFAIARYNSNGSLDTSFGTSGKVITDFAGGEEARAVALQSNGKILVAGHSSGLIIDSGFAIARYNANGALDLSFGSIQDQGKFVTLLGGESFARAVTLQPDGKIVVAGSAPPAYGLVRFDAGGHLDVEFGGAGRAALGGVSSAVALQPDGKIIVAGPSLIRFNADGTRDLEFGPEGTVIPFPGSPGFATALAVLPDGRIIVAGNVLSDFALARYNADGTPDFSFGSGGTVITDFGGNDRSQSMVLQPDGKIVMAGFSSAFPDFNFALARYDANGSLDLSFGSGGKVVTDFDIVDQANSLALQSNGKILVAGFVHHTIDGLNSDFAVARYNADGQLDHTFGSNGLIKTDLGGTDRSNAIAVQSDDRIIVAGSCSISSNIDFVLARYNSDGMLDLSFGTGGKVRTDFGSFDEAYAIAVQPDGRIVAVGHSSRNFAIARYEGVESFDICLQDETSRDTLRINSETGSYRFTRCSSGLVLEGTSSLMKRGSSITFQHLLNDRSISAKVDVGLNKGSASLRIFSLGVTITVIDRDTSNNSCNCP
ncbi:MAG TPA: hypothetical protein VFQ92_17315 [Blastocatellia bacterium]|nr:hypothetical protein [Blastocatellia bacterium]